jgi:hypothetical protein
MSSGVGTVLTLFGFAALAAAVAFLCLKKHETVAVRAPYNAAAFEKRRFRSGVVALLAAVAFLILGVVALAA